MARNDTRGPELPSDRIYRLLVERLENGEWSPGEKLPSADDLAAQYSASKGTVVAVLRRLHDEQRVRIIPNWGTFALER